MGKSKGSSSKGSGSKGGSKKPTKAVIKKAAGDLARDSSPPKVRRAASKVMNQAQGNNT
jgi:hypothetical protein